jgi:hypothetical protein
MPEPTQPTARPFLCTKCGVTPPAAESDMCRGCIDALSWQAHERECERAAVALINERQRRA